MKEKPIAFYPQLARELGSIEAALFYQQLYYWSDKVSREDGFIYKSAPEMERETTITEKQQRKIREDLTEREWILSKKVMVRNCWTWAYRPIVDLEVGFTPAKGRRTPAETPAYTGQKASSSIQRIHTENTTDEASSSLTSIPGVETGGNYQPDYDPAKRKAGKRTPTEKQRDAFNAMLSITYYREKADAAGMDYLKIDDESANKRFQKQAKDFEKRYRANWKEVIDWWFDDGEGDWANFHPSNFFNISTYMKFDNKDSKAKKGGVKHYA